MSHDCYRFIVKGRVQGVFFRASTRDKAKQLGLSGWVRNITSGDVELIACGEASNIDKFREWLWQGPKFSKVIQVNSECLADDKMVDVRGFEIRRDG